MITKEQKERLAKANIDELRNEYFRSCQYGDLHTLKYLVNDMNFPVKERRSAGAHYAAMYGQLDVLKFLISKKIDLTTVGVNKLDIFGYACEYGHIHIIEYLLTKTPFKKHDTIETSHIFPLPQACEYGQLEIVKYLLTSPNLSFKANIPFIISKSLAIACKNNQNTIIDYLVFEYKVPTHPLIVDLFRQYPELNSKFLFRELNNNTSEKEVIKKHKL